MDVFDQELQKQTVFADRDVLSISYVPNVLLHREKEIEKIMKVLAPVLSGKKPHNLFLYGKTGTGKTSCTKRVLERLDEAKKKSGACISNTYINCKVANTKYQVLQKCVESCYRNEDFRGSTPAHLFDKLLAHVRDNRLEYIVVLDEVDNAKDLDDLLYMLTRANDELQAGHVMIIGITNKATFKKELDPRVKSTLCEEEMVFPPYNADQMRSIIEQRVQSGFKPGAVEDSAVNLAAAVTAQEGGDARMGLRIMLKAGEIADEEGAPKVTDDHVLRGRKGAEEAIMLDTINNLPEHEILLLYAIASLTEEGGKYVRLDGSYEDTLITGEVYNKYESICRARGKEARSARWCKEYLNDLDMQGIVAMKRSGKGVRGNTTLIKLTYPSDKIKSVIEKSLAR